MKFIETIRAPITDTALTDEGFLIAQSTPIARPGVFPYMTMDGKSMQAKLPDDIFNKATIASANGKPITNNHPPVSVTANNIKQFEVGMSMNDAAIKDDKLSVTMVVTDEQAIRDVQAGKRELSIGFTADIVPKSGKFDGMVYDHVQQNIRINHIAIVDKGRAGKDVALKTDEMDENMAYRLDEEVEKKKEVSVMDKITIDGKEFDLTQDDCQKQINDFVSNLKKKAGKPAVGADSVDAALKMANDYKEDLEKVNGEKAVLEAQVVKLTKDAADAEAELDNRVAARVALEKQAVKVLGDSADLPKTEKEIKIAVIKHINKDIAIADDASDAFIDGAYSVALSAVKTPNPDVLGAKNVTDSVDDEIAKAKAARLNLKK